MARYNTFRYNEQKYGTGPATTNLLWTVQVDWDGDGSFDGINEASRMIDFTLERGRDSMVGPRGFEPMRVGQAIGIFLNNDGRYDPYDTSSPLYPNVRPGKLVKIKVQNGNAGTNYDVMYGVIADVQPFSKGREQFARIVFQDGFRWLKDQQVLSGYKTGDDIQTIVEYIATQASWPWTVSADDSALMADTLAYWWTWKSPGLTELREMEQSVVGTCFHGRDGVLYFYHRDFAHNRTQAITQSVILQDIVLPLPWELIYNDIIVNAYYKLFNDVYTSGVIANQIWSMGTSAYHWMAIGNGETITIDATFKYSTAARFTASGDMDLVTLIYDNGSEVSADCTISYTTPSQGTRITITNNHGSAVTLKGATFDADIVDNPYTLSRQAQDSTSQTDYGKRTMTIGGFWREDNDDTQAIADWLLAELKDPQNGVTIQIENRPTYQFYLDLYDRVELNISAKDINTNFRVGKIEHEWLSDNGQAVRTTMKLEPYLTVFS